MEASQTAASNLRGQNSKSPELHFLPVGKKHQHVQSQIHPKLPIKVTHFYIKPSSTDTAIMLQFSLPKN